MRFAKRSYLVNCEFRTKKQAVFDVNSQETIEEHIQSKTAYQIKLGQPGGIFRCMFDLYLFLVDSSSEFYVYVYAYYAYVPVCAIVWFDRGPLCIRHRASVHEVGVWLPSLRVVLPAGYTLPE